MGLQAHRFIALVSAFAVISAVFAVDASPVILQAPAAHVAVPTLVAALFPPPADPFTSPPHHLRDIVHASLPVLPAGAPSRVAFLFAEDELEKPWDLEFFAAISGGFLSLTVTAVDIEDGNVEDIEKAITGALAATAAMPENAADALPKPYARAKPVNS